MLLAASAARAELTTYTSQSAYLAAVGTTGVDTFDDLDIEPYDTPFPRTAGDISYVATTGPGNTRAYGASDDDIDWYLSSSRRTDSITFDTFGTPIAGAGGYFWGSDIAGYTVFAPYITVTATDSTGATLTYTITDPVPTSFLGFVSDARIVSLSVATGDQLGADGYGIWPTVNNLHLSVAAVPEPGTWAMLLGGLGMLCWTARRRQNQGSSSPR
ncbi:PEP-CTERM sorting domain-containing protein [Massilia dura]|uniref:PEP-CTERM sorting domain-containing protein n=1 Tax=Pseudoduganella dura TaxID=321982 RepID=A0A6I3XCX9_9BURK|nr:PEP-CTERM sorting domain-containing protein [Pseudoduganella dura]MUI12390.1 PEP-CTERM sorting domain-containing protein [Pseudoduganella dura]